MENYKLKQVKKFKFLCKYGKKVIKFGDIEIEKQKFTNIKGLFQKKL